MQFSSSLVEAHKRLAPHLPIKRFAAIVSPQAIGLSSSADFYAPVRFSVQVSGKANDPAGIIRMDVAVKKNPDWLRDMKAQLVDTMRLGNDASAIELRTVTGMPLERVPLEHLHTVGKLFVASPRGSDTPLRVEALPPVPAEYRVTKVSDLKRWATNLADSLPQAVAAALKGKNIYEVDEALRSDGGAVIKAIQEHIASSASKQGFAEFVRLHQANSAKRAEPEACKQLLDKVSKHILTYIRTFINASQKDVMCHIASEMAQKAAASAKKGEEHLTGSVLVSSAPKGPTRPNLYASLVADAVKVPMLQKTLVSAVYNFDGVVALRSAQSNNNKLLSAARPIAKRVHPPAAHHPWFAHIHHTLLPLRGTYPSDYLTRHTRKDMSARAPYVGDLHKTYEAYHRFAGVHAAPPPLRIKGGVPLVECGASSDDEKEINAPLWQSAAPIGCHTSSRHHRRRSSSSSSDEDIRGELVGNAMPKLIPIGSSAAAGGGGTTMPKLIPIGSSAPSGGGGTTLPKLIPIGSSAAAGGGGTTMPKLIPIGAPAGGGTKMPKLIPIGGHYPHHRRHKSGSDSDSDDGSMRYMKDDIEVGVPVDEFPHLPGVEDIFK